MKQKNCTLIGSNFTGTSSLHTVPSHPVRTSSHVRAYELNNLSILSVRTTKPIINREYPSQNMLRTIVRWTYTHTTIIAHRV